MVQKKKLARGKFKEQSLAKTKARRRGLEHERRRSDECGHPPRNDVTPDLRVEMRSTKDLQVSPHYAREIESAHVDRVRRSIVTLTFTQPILVSGNEIIDGVIRAKAAAQLGLEQVPVIDCGHLNPTEIRQLRLATNRTGELGTYSFEKLKAEFASLIELGADLQVTAFTDQERDIVLLDDVELSEAGDEEQIAIPDRPVSELGDLWVMGVHRVICGSALDVATYLLLLAGTLAHLLLTDPPYNVPIKGNVSNKHGEFAMASGEMTDSQFQDFLTAFLAIAVTQLAAGSVGFVFMDWRSIHRVYEAGFAAALRLINLGVWYKESGSMGSLYRSAHELVAVFCKGDKPHTNNVELGRHGRDRQNVWAAPGANRPGSSANEMLALHATPKPVELLVDKILDVTRPGHTVLDPFLGSGSTLIAAEKTGRRCCGIEYEPRFVDVSIERWMRLTGEQAILESTGETFAEVAERRRTARDAGPKADASVAMPQPSLA